MRDMDSPETPSEVPMPTPEEVELILTSLNQHINVLVAHRENLANIFKPIMSVDLYQLLGEGGYEMWTDLIATEMHDSGIAITGIAQQIMSLEYEQNP